MVQVTRILFGMALLAAMPAHSQVLFEAYANLEIAGQNRGHVVQRYSSDPKTHRITVATLTVMRSPERTVFESLQAVSNADLKPLSYHYERHEGESSKTIDATVSAGQLTAKVKRSGSTKVRVVNKPVRKGVFFSSFLVFLLVQNPALQKPLPQPTQFIYKALSEEDLEVAEGKAWIENESVYKSQKVFPIRHEFNGSSFTTLMTNNGEVLLSESPANHVRVEVVADPSAAKAALLTEKHRMERLFGRVPEGTINVLAREAFESKMVNAGSSSSSTDDKWKTLDRKTSDKPDKSKGVAPGRGLEIK